MIYKWIKINLTYVIYLFFINKNLFLNFIYIKKVDILKIIMLTFFYIIFLLYWYKVIKN